MTSAIEERGPGARILDLLSAGPAGVGNIALVDVLEREGFRPGEILRTLRDLESRGILYSRGGYWCLAALRRSS